MELLTDQDLYTDLKQNPDPDLCISKFVSC